MAKRFNHKSSIIDATSITYDAHLVFDVDGGLRLTRQASALARGERSMAIVLRVPRSVFAEPALKASITIADDTHRSEIIAKVGHNAAEVLREHMGVDLNLTVEPAVS